MQTLELLAPARDLATGIAAIDSGADAVYIGAARFGARAAAGNELTDIEKLCNYAHRFQARVYATVNTMLEDDEMDDAVKLIHHLYEHGVDAVLIQDMRLLQQPLPPIAIHASTQCDNRNAEDVQRLYDCGIRRVVLARELSLEQIRDIRRKVPADMELEAFVHGALCVSYSGRCYASEYCFGRSANRGECAQFCRLRFSLTDEQGNRIGPDAHYLSLRDMCRIEDLEQMAEAGVCSFKIEGRLKDAAYVRNVTAAYHNALNRLTEREPQRYRRAATGTITLSFTPDVRRTFNRGYTDYFLNGERTSDMWSPFTPKATGQRVGVVKRIGRGWIEIETDTGIEIANGDGLCFFDNDSKLRGFRVNNVVGSRLYLFRMPEEIREGRILYRNQDTAFEHLVNSAQTPRTIPIRINISPVNEGYCLTGTFTDNIQATHTVAIDFPFTHQEAQQRQYDNIVRQLSRWGNTCFTCEEVEVSPEMATHFLPSSLLSDMRRRLAQRLLEVLQYPPENNRHTIYNIKEADETTQRQLSRSIGHMPRSLQHTDTLPPLMQCRFCLRHALGGCRRHPLPKDQQPILSTDIKPGTQPLYLVLNKEQRFRLHFDCQHCQMTLHAQP